MWNVLVVLMDSGTLWHH